MIDSRPLRHLVLAAAFLAALVASSSARADLVHDFVQQGQTIGQFGVVALDIGFQLTLHDDFVSEPLDRHCFANGCFGTGDFTTFTLALSLDNALQGLLGATADRYGETDTGFLDGDSGSLVWNTASANMVSLTFGQGVWTATVNSDLIAGACGQPGCVASGTLSTPSPVPEPASLGVLAAGLVGIAAGRRRRAIGAV